MPPRPALVTTLLMAGLLAGPSAADPMEGARWTGEGCRMAIVPEGLAGVVSGGPIYADITNTGALTDIYRLHCAVQVQPTAGCASLSMPESHSGWHADLHSVDQPTSPRPATAIRPTQIPIAPRTGYCVCTGVDTVGFPWSIASGKKPCVAACLLSSTSDCNGLPPLTGDGGRRDGGGLGIEVGPARRDRP